MRAGLVIERLFSYALNLVHPKLPIKIYSSENTHPDRSFRFTHSRLPIPNCSSRFSYPGLFIRIAHPKLLIGGLKHAGFKQLGRYAACGSFEYFDLLLGTF